MSLVPNRRTEIDEISSHFLKPPTSSLKIDLEKVLHKHQLHLTNFEALRSFFLGILMHIFYSQVPFGYDIEAGKIHTSPGHIWFIPMSSSLKSGTNYQSKCFHIYLIVFNKENPKFSLSMLDFEKLGIDYKTPGQLNMHLVNVGRYHTERFYLVHTEDRIERFEPSFNSPFTVNVKTVKLSITDNPISRKFTTFSRSSDNIITAKLLFGSSNRNTGNNLEFPDYVPVAMRHFFDQMDNFRIFPTLQNIYRFIEGGLCNFVNRYKMETFVRFYRHTATKIRDLTYISLRARGRYFFKRTGIPIQLKIVEPGQLNALNLPHQIRTESKVAFQTSIHLSIPDDKIFQVDKRVAPIPYLPMIRAELFFTESRDYQVSLMFDEMSKVVQIYGPQKCALVYWLMGRFSRPSQAMKYIVDYQPALHKLLFPKSFASNRPFPIVTFLLKLRNEAVLLNINTKVGQPVKIKGDMLEESLSAVFREHSVQKILIYDISLVDTGTTNSFSLKIATSSMDIDHGKPGGLKHTFLSQVHELIDMNLSGFGNNDEPVAQLNTVEFLLTKFAGTKMHFRADIQAAAFLEGALSMQLVVIHPDPEDPSVLGLISVKSGAHWTSLWWRVFAERVDLAKASLMFRDRCKTLARERGVLGQHTIFAVARIFENSGGINFRVCDNTNLILRNR